MKQITNIVMNIQMKIEAKKHVQKFGILTTANEFKELYKIFAFNTFQLPYKVRKLSKRARRNLM